MSTPKQKVDQANKLYAADREGNAHSFPQQWLGAEIRQNSELNDKLRVRILDVVAKGEYKTENLDRPSVVQTR